MKIFSRIFGKKGKIGPDHSTDRLDELDWIIW